MKKGHFCHKRETESKTVLDDCAEYVQWNLTLYWMFKDSRCTQCWEYWKTSTESKAGADLKTEGWSITLWPKGEGDEFTAPIPCTCNSTLAVSLKFMTFVVFLFWISENCKSTVQFKEIDLIIIQGVQQGHGGNTRGRAPSKSTTTETTWKTTLVLEGLSLSPQMRLLTRGDSFLCKITTRMLHDKIKNLLLIPSKSITSHMVEYTCLNRGHKDPLF